MGDEAANASDAVLLPVEVVVFLDANMPNVDKCNGKCAGKGLVFCKHKFIFSTEVIHPGKALDKLNDFLVLEYFLKLIRSHDDWCNADQKPIFVLLTKDVNFLEDAERAYKKVAKRRKGKPLFNTDSNFVCDGELEIIIKLISCKNYGSNRYDNLRCAIQILNDFWNWNRQDSQQESF